MRQKECLLLPENPTGGASPPKRWHPTIRNICSTDEGQITFSSCHATRQQATCLTPRLSCTVSSFATEASHQSEELRLPFGCWNLLSGPPRAPMRELSYLNVIGEPSGGRMLVCIATSSLQTWHTDLSLISGGSQYEASGHWMRSGRSNARVRVLLRAERGRSINDFPHASDRLRRPNLNGPSDARVWDSSRRCWFK